MGSTGRIDPEGTAIIRNGRVLSRRDFLRAAGVAGLGLTAHQLATGAGKPVLWQEAAAAAAPMRDAVSELAAALDYDAERIFRFVSDEVRYDPYSGILRGARGTLNSRAGNSADQALLLAALLDASLLPVRFAMGEIDSATADALMAGAEADVDSIRRHGLEALAGTLPGREPDPVELTPEQQELLDRALANSEQVVAWARDQLERTVGTIEAALQEAGVELLDGFTTMPDSERARHIWVQVAATDDWIDLDPTMPGAGQGEVLARAAETPDALPEEMAHLVELSVIGEALDGETLSEKLLVGYRDRSDAIAGLPIALMNTPPEAIAALGVSVAGALDGGSGYVPVIIVGDTAVVGANPIRLAVAGPGRELAAEGGDDFLEAGASAGETTAQWVELTIRSPEAEPIVVRREIFDRIGPARRAAGGVTVADIAPVDGVDLGDGGEAQALPALTTHWLTVSTGLPSRDDAVMDIVPGEDDRSGAVVSQAYHLLGAAAAMELTVPAGLRPFIDAPNVTAYSLIMRPSPIGEHSADAVVDIWHRSHGVVPVNGTTSALPPAVTAGVLAHVAERVLGGEAARDLDGAGPPLVASVGAVFDLAESEDIPWRVLRGAGATEGLPWTDDARATLERSLADGWVAVAPERPVVIGDRERVGWWLVDPDTGRTMDQLDDGRGEEGLEFTATVAVGPVGYWNLAWRTFGCALTAAVLLAATGSFLGTGAVFVQAASAGGDKGTWSAIGALLSGAGAVTGGLTAVGVISMC